MGYGEPELRAVGSGGTALHGTEGTATPRAPDTEAGAAP